MPTTHTHAHTYTEILLVVGLNWNIVGILEAADPKPPSLCSSWRLCTIKANVYCSLLHCRCSIPDIVTLICYYPTDTLGVLQVVSSACLTELQEVVWDFLLILKSLNIPVCTKCLHQKSSSAVITSAIKNSSWYAGIWSWLTCCW